MIGAALVGVSVGLAPTDAEAQVNGDTFTVNSTDNRADVNGADGICQTSSGTCSLRAAVEQANYTRGPNTIRFNIAGNGLKTISVSELVLWGR